MWNIAISTYKLLCAQSYLSYIYISEDKMNDVVVVQLSKAILLLMQNRSNDEDSVGIFSTMSKVASNAPTWTY